MKSAISPAKIARANGFTVAGVLAGFLTLVPGVSQAGPTIDFSTLGSNNTSLGSSTSAGGITISAYETDFSTASTLWVRNEGVNDDGLGVCSSSETCPTGGAGGGDINELSNESKVEWIVLERPASTTWLELWVSSLDNGGDPIENGTLYWSNTLGDLSNSFEFTYGDFGSDFYGELLSLSPSGFDPTAEYLMFRAGADGDGASSGFNNDYLVWGATLSQPCLDCGQENVPEPFTVSLFGAGLAGMGLLRRRRRKVVA